MDTLVSTIVTFEHEAQRYKKVLEHIDAIIANLSSVRQVVEDCGKRLEQKAKAHAEFATRLFEENLEADLRLPGWGLIAGIDPKIVRSILERNVNSIVGTIQSGLSDIDRWQAMFEKMDQDMDAEFNLEFPPEAVDTTS